MDKRKRQRNLGFRASPGGILTRELKRRPAPRAKEEKLAPVPRFPLMANRKKRLPKVEVAIVGRKAVFLRKLEKSLWYEYSVKPFAGLSDFRDAIQIIVSRIFQLDKLLGRFVDDLEHETINAQQWRMLKVVQKEVRCSELGFPEQFTLVGPDFVLIVATRRNENEVSFERVPLNFRTAYEIRGLLYLKLQLLEADLETFLLDSGGVSKRQLSGLKRLLHFLSCIFALLANASGAAAEDLSEKEKALQKSLNSAMAAYTSGGDGGGDEDSEKDVVRLYGELEEQRSILQSEETAAAVEAINKLSAKELSPANRQSVVRAALSQLLNANATNLAISASIPELVTLEQLITSAIPERAKFDLFGVEPGDRVNEQHVNQFLSRHGGERIDADTNLQLVRVMQELIKKHNFQLWMVQGKWAYQYSISSAARKDASTRQFVLNPCGQQDEAKPIRSSSLPLGLKLIHADQGD